MKKPYYYLSKFLLAAVIIPVCMLASCSDKEEPEPGNIIWDINGAEFIIRIEDKNGNDLLDPANDFNFVGDKMWMVQDEQQHPAIWTLEEYENMYFPTRYYVPLFNGLVWNGIWGNPSQSRYHLSYGEFDGNTDQTIKAMLLIERINTVFPMELKHTIRWKNNRPVITNTITYSGFNCANDEDGDHVIEGNVICIRL